MPEPIEQEPIKKFVWVSVLGADPEPAGLRVRDGKREVYTVGCPDPFYPDEPNPRVHVLGDMTVPAVVDIQAAFKPNAERVPDEVPAPAADEAEVKPKTKGKRAPKPKEPTVPKGHGYMGWAK